jgi:serine/threonine protein kinase
MSTSLRVGDSWVELDEEIGRGGMARIWLAHRKGAAGFSRRVVVKEMLTTTNANEVRVQRFVREAALVARLKHPNIVEVLDAAELDGVHFIVMEYIQGEDLAAILERREARHEPVPVGMAIAIGAAVADALAYAHDFLDADGSRHRVVHRDVSPENIMISERGEVKLVDFGVAKDLDLAALTQAGDLVGKPIYLPPESLHGTEPTPAWDIYGLGVTLYRALAGRLPFTVPEKGGGIMAVLNAIATTDPTPLAQCNEEVPPALAEIVAHAMARDPRKRYSAAAALQRDLVALLPSLDPGEPTDPRQLLAERGTGPTDGDSAPTAVLGSAPMRTSTAVAPLRHAEPAPTGNADVAAGNVFDPPTSERPRIPFRRWELLVIVIAIAIVGGAILRGVLNKEPPSQPANDTVEPVSVAAKDAPTGSILVKCGSWGYVHIDGKTVGLCPVPKVRAPIGRHRVVFEEREKTRVEEVEVHDGEEVVVDFRPPPPPSSEVLVPVR